MPVRDDASVSPCISMRDAAQCSRKLIKSDPDRKIYGHILFMASCSYASIGALNAESFCERVLSAANLVVTDGNTLL